MKAAFALLIVVGLGVFLAWHFGMRGFDPEKQAVQFKEEIQPGTSVDVVLEKYPPRKWRVIALHQGFQKPSPPENFDREHYDSLLKQGKLPYGYIFDYHFTSEHVYEVLIAPNGEVVQVGEAITFGDLTNPGGLLQRD